MNSFYHNVYIKHNTKKTKIPALNENRDWSARNYPKNAEKNDAMAVNIALIVAVGSVIKIVIPRNSTSTGIFFPLSL